MYEPVVPSVLVARDGHGRTVELDVLSETRELGWRLGEGHDRLSVTAVLEQSAHRPTGRYSASLPIIIAYY